MARNFYTPINLNVLELQNAVIGNLSTTSINNLSGAALSKGRFQFDSTANVLKYYDGSAWQTVSSGAGSFTLGSTSINLGSTTTTVAGLTLSGPTFSGTITTPLTTAGVVLTNGSGVLSSAATLANSYLTNSTISGVALGSTLASLSLGTGLSYDSGTTYTGGNARTINVATASTSTAGIVQLSDSTSTTGSTKAATETAVKAAYDRGSLGVTNAATAQAEAESKLSKAGTGSSPMTGVIDMGNNKITGLGAPTLDDDAVTKAYVDNVSAGLNAHAAVEYATTGALGTTGNLVGGTITTTYANGTLGVGATLTIATSSNWTAITIDGESLTVTDRVLIKNQATAAQNGIYTVTSVGAVGNTTSFVFTRSLDNDQALELAAGDLTYVIAGTANGGDGYVLISEVATVGTDAVTWTQFSGAGAVPTATTSDLGIASFPSAQFSVSSGAVTVANLAGSVISSGTVNPTYGGTGVNNGSNTITLGGNLTTATGAITLTAALAGSSVTLPASGTLVNSAVTTLSSLVSVGTITTGVWNGTDIAVADGGTGASDAAGARANLGATTKVTGAGSGSGTTITVNHALGQWVTAQLFDSSGNLVEVDVQNTSTSGGTTTFTFASSQTLTGFQYVIVG
jgi:hypothetical protein